MSYKEEQGWQVDVTANSTNNDVFDSTLLDGLQHRLEIAGLAVTTVALRDRQDQLQTPA